MSRPFRDELKFVIRFAERTALLERWRRNLSKDPYTNEDAVTPILSQYYDTPRLRFYREKLDGIGFRNKVRLRTYGYRFRPGQATFIEIKQRLGGRVRKIRQRIAEFRFRHLSPGNWRFDDRRAESAFGTLLERHQLRPSAQVWYLREAYEALVEPDVRVTFDSSLTALHPGEALETGRMADPLSRIMPDTLVILEVKATTGIPAWVAEGARNVELVQKPVPKYVLAVEKLGLDRAPAMWG